MKASDISIDKNISLLFKGPWGHGKTLAAASFAIDGPVFLAYFDKKKPIELVTYFRQFGDVGRRILNNIEYEVYGAENAEQYLIKVISMTKDCRYSAFITDSVTNLTSAAINWSLSFRDDRKKKEVLKIIPDWDDYKVETNMASKALDICRTLPCNIIWIAHPIASTKIEGSGSSQKVSKVNKLVSYGSKVADIVPGNFSEIYHFSKMSNWDAAAGKSSTRYLVSTDAVGDDFAKSNLGLKGEFDITEELFYNVWKAKLKEKLDEVAKQTEEQTTPKQPNPFAQVATNNPINQPTITIGRTWNPEKGAYE